jgi:hypothetical protein
MTVPPQQQRRILNLLEECMEKMIIVRDIVNQITRLRIQLFEVIGEDKPL